MVTPAIYAPGQKRVKEFNLKPIQTVTPSTEVHGTGRDGSQYRRVWSTAPPTVSERESLIAQLDTFLQIAKVNNPKL